MAKRHHLNYNSDELALHLRQSTGQGVDALFSPPSPPQPGTRIEPQAERDGSIQESKRARTHARQPASRQPPIERELRERILIKKHLSSCTFRFLPEELEALDRVANEINQKGKHKTSKNDVIRMALNWLLMDHKEKKHNSLLARVLIRI